MGATAQISNPMKFASRQVVDLGIVQGAWPVKVYAILSDKWTVDDLPDAATFEVAVRDAAATLQQPQDHPAGFAIFHMADDGFYLLISRFNNANNIRHSVFSLAQHVTGLKCAPLADPKLIACIWEMRLMMAEADAWIETVLRPGNGLTQDALSAYLACRYEGTV
ncbi:hypothetical protein [Puniceibacterium sediminis]|uniref:Uncharacterized protein n=1 Tax=Puniceibacterium sediminis TaxID=1608407 RepID=A0A238YVR1_9RHOB|nr:hypothetical protein [Puniceibacterium sediminis]SNR74559.1 hypothetical protein SAMN06265370_12019 [Puniceibacterium sediminis]